jgi:hypothetical protein
MSRQLLGWERRLSLMRTTLADRTASNGRASRVGAGMDLSGGRKTIVSRSAAECRSDESPATVVWTVYAVLTVAVSAFLVAVLLMATGVLATPRT